jgi:hypothetical protein
MLVSCDQNALELRLIIQRRDLLQVFSWEPLRCHDMVDVGWHKLADLCIHEGKLLGCSFNQSCVGVWVVDLQVRSYSFFSWLFLSQAVLFAILLSGMWWTIVDKLFLDPFFLVSIVKSCRAYWRLLNLFTRQCLAIASMSPFTSADNV